jgi:hypothetical protein
MSDSRKITIESWRKEFSASAASLSILPFWYPFFERSLYQRAQILQSKSPGDLSHSTFFSQKRNYYRGITANIFTMQPLFPAAEWMLNTLLRKIQMINKRDPNLAEKFVSGFITGSATALLANPYEATNIAAQKYREPPTRAFLRILNESGPKGFYTGVTPMAIRNGAFVSSLLVTSPELKKMLDKSMPGSGASHHLATTALGAAIPATLFTCMVVPFDLAAVMRQSDPSEEVFRSAFQAMKKAYSKHGIAALKAGTLLRLLACNIEMIGFNLLNNSYNNSLSDVPRPK